LSIEAFACTNLLMNFMLLTVGARCVGHIRWKRVICAALAGTLYAVAACAWTGGTRLRSLTAQSACLMLMAWIVFGGKALYKCGKCCVCIAAGTLLCGGAMVLLSRWFEPGSPMLTAGGWFVMAAAVCAADRLQGGEQTQGQILLRIGTRMGSVDIRALLDTGNRLREPLSGLPVLIVREKALRAIVDTERVHSIKNRLMPGFRWVEYSSLGGNGKIVCFRPESAMMLGRNGWTEAPDIWVGIYRGRLPADVEAIAPPVLGRISQFERRMMSMR